MREPSSFSWKYASGLNNQTPAFATKYATVSMDAICLFLSITLQNTQPIPLTQMSSARLESFKSFADFDSFKKVFFTWWDRDKDTNINYNGKMLVSEWTWNTAWLKVWSPESGWVVVAAIIWMVCTFNTWRVTKISQDPGKIGWSKEQ